VKFDKFKGSEFLRPPVTSEQQDHQSTTHSSSRTSARFNCMVVQMVSERSSSK
jgi:hypothetical protein